MYYLVKKKNSLLYPCPNLTIIKSTLHNAREFPFGEITTISKNKFDVLYIEYVYKNYLLTLALVHHTLYLILNLKWKFIADNMQYQSTK